jgi:hypothetical protein
VFYLILRALDTVEDDMKLPSDVKISLLRVFHEKLTDRYNLRSYSSILACRNLALGLKRDACIHFEVVIVCSNSSAKGGGLIFNTDISHIV